MTFVGAVQARKVVWPGRWSGQQIVVEARHEAGGSTPERRVRGGVLWSASGGVLEVVHPRCCGIDVHPAGLAVCVAIKDKGTSEKHKLRCGTTTAELLRLADWLQSHQVTHAAMEATGVYWKPVGHIWEGHFELLLANPTQVQALRGRKTDLKDGERMADFLQHGLLPGSFVPPNPSHSYGM